MITIVKPSWAWLPMSEHVVGMVPKHLEECGRTCYKSEDRITEGSADKFVRGRCRDRHESVLEHASLTARIVCSRAASHQLVRHRIAAYSQESMRYVNYGKSPSLKVICPPSIGLPPGEYRQGHSPYSYSKRQLSWLSTMHYCYLEYQQELADGIKPEDARFVLPNACKTEVVATYNLRMWRHVICERGLNKHAQWEIRGIFSEIFADLVARIPCVFDDLYDLVDLDK